MIYFRETICQLLIIVLKFNEKPVRGILHHIVITVCRESSWHFGNWDWRLFLVEHNKEDVFRFLTRLLLELRLKLHKSLSLQGKHDVVYEFRRYWIHVQRVIRYVLQCLERASLVMPEHSSGAMLTHLYRIELLHYHSWVIAYFEWTFFERIFFGCLLTS